MGIVATAGINNRIADDVSFAKHVTDALERFIRHDWGDLCDGDKQMNDEALKTKMQVTASYGTDNDKIYIIRIRNNVYLYVNENDEAQEYQGDDKDAYHGPTTILYPYEY